MDYCIFRFNKIKSRSMMKQVYDHHFRFAEPVNVDKEYEALNDRRVTPDGDYISRFHERLNELEYYKDHNFRKNGVMAYDVLFAYSPSAAGKIDLEKWKQDNVDWLNETFGKENVLGVVYHYDEAGYTEASTIHGHAAVIPVDDNGKVNASYYTGDKAKVSELQDRYAEVMKAHGLERGIEQSLSRHDTPKRFYAKLEDAVYGMPMPDRTPGESAEKYVERVKDAWRTERAAHVREIRDKNREIVEIRSDHRSETEKDRVIRSLRGKMEKYREADRELIREFGSRQEAVQLAKTMKLLNEGIENHPDTEKANRIANDVIQLISWSEKERRKKEREKDQEIADVRK